MCENCLTDVQEYDNWYERDQQQKHSEVLIAEALVSNDIEEIKKLLESMKNTLTILLKGDHNVTI